MSAKLHLFESQGIALEDVALAAKVYEQALKAGLVNACHSDRSFFQHWVLLPVGPMAAGLYPLRMNSKGFRMREVVDYEAVTSAPIEEVVELYKTAGWWQESPEARAIIPSMIRGSLCFMVARSSRDESSGWRALSRTVTAMHTSRTSLFWKAIVNMGSAANLYGG